MGRKPVPAGFSSWEEALGAGINPGAPQGAGRGRGGGGPSGPSPLPSVSLPPQLTQHPIDTSNMTEDEALDQVIASMSRFPSMEEDCKDAVLSLSPSDALDVLSRFNAGLGACPSLEIYVEAKKKILAKMGTFAREGIMAECKSLNLIDDNAKAALWDLPPDDAMNIIYTVKRRGHAWHNPSASAFKAAQDVRNRCQADGIFIPPPPRLDENGREIQVVPPPSRPPHEWGSAGIPPSKGRGKGKDKGKFSDPGGFWQEGRGEKRQLPDAYPEQQWEDWNKPTGAMAKASPPPPDPFPPVKAVGFVAPKSAAPAKKMDPKMMLQLGQKLSQKLGVPLSSLSREQLDAEMKKAMAEM